MIFLAPLKPLLLKIFIYVVLPKVQAWANRVKLDPNFKLESDKIFADLNSAQTTEELRKVAVRLYELQK